MQPSPGGSLRQEQPGCGGSLWTGASRVCLPDVFPNRDPHACYSKSVLDLALGSWRWTEGKPALLHPTHLRGVFAPEGQASGWLLVTCILVPLTLWSGEGMCFPGPSSFLGY